MKKLFAVLLMCGVALSCKKDDIDPPAEETLATAETTPNDYPDTVWTATGSGPRLIFKFKFDSTQIRLDNLGNPSTVASGNSAYSPKFNKMAAHYIELAPNDMTQIMAGQVLYRAEEIVAAGQNAIRFSKSVVVRENVVFYSIPLSQVNAGTYKWLRLSLSYQNYDIPYKANALTTPGKIGTGTIASFLGFKTYVPKYMIKDKPFVPSSALPVGGPNVAHPQGYWGFETYIPGYSVNNGYWMGDGQTASTTVVNPNPSSPIPAGSCVVTAHFADMSSVNQALTITGNETNDIIITVSVSTNKSFEFVDPNGDGYYQPENLNEWPVDMGVRGMIPKVQY